MEMDMSSLDGIIDGMDSCSTSVSGKASDSSCTVKESWTVSASGEACESTNTSLSHASTATSGSNQSDLGNAANKPHKGNDPRWEAIQAVRARDGSLGLHHFRLLKRLGCGDIGSVYLAELKGSNCVFAMKVMDKASLASRKKLARAQTEKEILMSLDHPFLPTLYTHFETEKFTCLVMEFCSGGDLHTLRQRQSGKHFSEQAARFYASEVLLGLEYLHMMGIIYRDLKPENVLVREDGHIMLSDFDLALRCIVSPMLVKSSSSHADVSRKVLAYCVQPACVEPSCLAPTCATPPSCFSPRLFAQRSIKKASKANNSEKSSKLNNNIEKGRKVKIEFGNQAMGLPEVIVEPTGARSMSFVGTHEYLAPEIIKGEGHGSAVDWWTFGIFMYELLHGKTPFKGAGNRATLFNVVGQPLKFPESPVVSFGARDLIRGLLVKDPQYRLAYKRGASEIKQHPFFDGVNWALIRSMLPPDVPKPFEVNLSGSERAPIPVSASSSSDPKPGGITSSSSNSSYVEFEFF